MINDTPLDQSEMIKKHNKEVRRIKRKNKSKMGIIQ